MKPCHLESDHLFDFNFSIKYKSLPIAIGRDCNVRVTVAVLSVKKGFKKLFLESLVLCLIFLPDLFQTFMH